MRFAMPLVVVVALLGLLLVGLFLNPREVPSPFIGKAAPAFSIPRLEDPARTLSRDDLTGQVTLLNVWATWCVGCRQEHPLLVEIARSGEVPIVGLNYKDQANDARAWLDRLGNPYVTNGFDPDGRVGLDYGVYGLPETFVIDRDGVIVHKHIGAVTPDAWENEIRPLIAKLRTEGR